ncbi:hypothetical protein TNCV_2801481 [Trichonephila clavipes]|nr:hypothetical protein TNCV_2801481 [Trichonephila clavipes]
MYVRCPVVFISLTVSHKKTSYHGNEIPCLGQRMIGAKFSIVRWRNTRDVFSSWSRYRPSKSFKKTTKIEVDEIKNMCAALVKSMSRLVEKFTSAKGRHILHYTDFSLCLRLIRVNVTSKYTENIRWYHFDSKKFIIINSCRPWLLLVKQTSENDSDENIRLDESDCEESEGIADIIDNIPVIPGICIARDDTEWISNNNNAPERFAIRNVLR